MTVHVDYDCEFLEDGSTIALISIGMVADSGDHLYLVNRDAPLDRIAAHPWLMEYVVPSLPLLRLESDAGPVLVWDSLHPDYALVRPKAEIAERVRRFVTQFASPQLWADWGAYDHVCLAQLWGTMMDLPPGVPMYTNELRQEIRRLGSPGVPVQAEGHHHALEDARYQRQVREYLAGLEAKRRHCA